MDKNQWNKYIVLWYQEIGKEPTKTQCYLKSKVKEKTSNGKSVLGWRWGNDDLGGTDYCLGSARRAWCLLCMNALSFSNEPVCRYYGLRLTDEETGSEKYRNLNVITEKIRGLCSFRAWSICLPKPPRKCFVDVVSFHIGLEWWDIFPRR